MRKFKDIVVCYKQGTGGSKVIVTDKNSRVYLLDAKSFLVMKVWKGYRDASLSLMGLNYFVIFLPKRNILEVYEIN